MTKTEMLLAQIESEQKMNEQQLISSAKWLAEDLLKMVKRVESGEHVNSLGVIQGRGSEIDNLCGKLATIREIKERIKAYDVTYEFMQKAYGTGGVEK